MTATPTGPGKILVVEDDDHVRGTVARILTNARFEVATAMSGKEALAKLTEDTALIVLDIIMPETDGLDVLRWLRKEACQTPVLAISGGGILDKEHVLEVAQRLGAAKTLAKPFTADRLLGAVRDALRWKAASG